MGLSVSKEPSLASLACTLFCSLRDSPNKMRGSKSKISAQENAKCKINLYGRLEPLVESKACPKNIMTNAKSKKTGYKSMRLRMAGAPSSKV